MPCDMQCNVTVIIEDYFLYHHVDDPVYIVYTVMSVISPLGPGSPLSPLTDEVRMAVKHENTYYQCVFVCVCERES